MEQKEQDQADNKECQYEGCEHKLAKDSDFCIFHIPADVKQEKGLWEPCMDQFYDLVNNREGNFKGFVLKDVNIPEFVGREIKQEIDFNNAVFIGESVFSNSMKNTKFEMKADFWRANFSGEVSFMEANFKEKADFRGAYRIRDDW